LAMHKSSNTFKGTDMQLIDNLTREAEAHARAIILSGGSEV